MDTLWQNFLDPRMWTKCFVISVADENVYKYNSEKDEVFEGWPRLIRDEFGGKPGETNVVPDNLDTVFFDMRDKNLYFFKDDMVNITSFLFKYVKCYKSSNI